MSIRRKEQTCNSALKSLIHDLGMEERLLLVKTEIIWKELMGPSITSHTKKIHTENQNLFLFMDSAVIRNELHLNKNKILEAIHNKLEKKYFKSIKFV
ncbi:DciA family protein [Apibacter raozihei]|uniref:DciA family protein n=1 Tax=Apibacter TaxID=1778601 RepID=UPI000FE29E9C|nr:MULTISPECIES: DciA family protein [Apibacter]